MTTKGHLSAMNWEITRCAKLRGPGSTAFSELLSIDGVRFLPSSSFNVLNAPEAVGLSYKEYNRIEQNYCHRATNKAARLHKA